MTLFIIIIIVNLKEKDVCDNSEFSITVHVLKQEIFSIINVTNIVIIYNYDRIMMYSDIQTIFHEDVSAELLQTQVSVIFNIIVYIYTKIPETSILANALNQEE